jgi:hypothetical protein
MEGGLIGMRNGEHRRGIHLSAQKYYVAGRARYRGFDVKDDDTNLKETLPLSASTVFDAMRTAKNTTLDDWHTGQGPVTRRKSFNNFVETVWTPTVVANLEASSGLDQGPGRYCYDIKISKLQNRKKRDDDDINGSITRTRAIEILRLLRTKLSQIPDKLSKILFRGPKINNRYDGLIKGQYPDNEHDEPFSQTVDDDFLFAPTYDKDDGPSYEVFDKDWGLLIAVIKPQKNINNRRVALQNI